MVEAGLEAILIKVAGVGLQTKHLGKTLAQMQPTLLKLVSVLYTRSIPLVEGGIRMICTDHMFVVKGESTKP